MRFRRLAVLSGLGTVIAVPILADPAKRETLSGTANGVVRFARAGYNGLSAVYDYKFVVGPAEDKHGKGSDEHKRIKAEVDRRAAQRLLAVSKTQGGMYTKIGQYLSTLTHVLPKEWTETLSELQDKAKFRSWADVSRVFEEEFGCKPERVFREIDTQPLAAASLAQVHRGVTHEGQEVAIKIQYPDLRMIARSDMAALKFFFTVIAMTFSDFDYLWLFPEFQQSVKNELNFMQEAHNAERVASMFASNPNVHIPAVVRNLTSERVLTMEFIRGCKVNDVDAMKAMGITDPRSIASSVSQFFGDQIHVHGFVHCDPHPGNMMVRVKPGTKHDAQLVVLDHGMYRRLSPSFRSGYCKLWKALVMRDDELGFQACKDLGLEESNYDVMSLMLLQRSARSKTSLGTKMSKEEVDKLKSQYKDINAGDINKFMQKLPRDLLFVSRNTNMVRGLNVSLGGTARERFRITGKSAIRGLVLTDAIEQSTLSPQPGSASSTSSDGSNGTDSTSLSVRTEQYLSAQAAAGPGRDGGVAASTSHFHINTGSMPSTAASRPRAAIDHSKAAELVSDTDTLEDSSNQRVDGGGGSISSLFASMSSAASTAVASLKFGTGTTAPAGGAPHSSSVSGDAVSPASSSPASINIASFISPKAMTYERALREGRIHSKPTESELQREREQSGAGFLNTASLGRRIRLWWEISKLEQTLWVADTILAAAMWWKGIDKNALDGQKAKAVDAEMSHVHPDAAEPDRESANAAASAAAPQLK